MSVSGAENYTTAYTYDLANRLLSETRSASGATAAVTYTYDHNGNLLSKNTGSPATTVQNTYNSFNQLTTSVVGGTSVSYTYTPSGLRFTKRGTTYLYDGDVLALEIRGTSNTHKYTYGVDLISCSVYNASSSPKTTEYYYLRNAHGDVTYLTDAEGAITKTYEYDAFGNEENPVSTDDNPFRYAGEYYDKETGTYYLRARYYDPVIGRFTQEDPARHSTNWYLYCYCNPVRYIDPSGNVPVDTLLDGASAYFSLKDLLDDPSLANAGFLLWDVAAFFTPYVTGSYTAKGISWLGKADDVSDLIRGFTKVDNLADAANVFRANSKNIVGSYKDIKKLVKGLGIKGMEVHHLIEKRFAKTLNNMNPRYMSSVALDKSTHQTITTLMREYIPYNSIFKGTGELTTRTADAQDIWDALCKTYTHEDVNMPGYIDILKEDFIAAGFDLDWEHWKT